MDPRQRSGIIRLLIMCAAWALGEALVWQFRVAGLGLVVPALLATAAFFATRDITPFGGDTTYYRGRRIDRDRWRH